MTSRRFPRSRRGVASALSLDAHRDELNQAFPGLTDEELAVLDRNSSTVERPAGTVLCRQGALGREAMIVLSGEVTIRREGQDLDVRHAPVLVGEQALTRKLPYRSADVVARTPVHLVALSRREFATVLDACPHVAEVVDTLAIERAS